MSIEAPSVSVILSTFNQPRALELALLGYQRQTWAHFELVVADDGSDRRTHNVVETFNRAGNFFFELKHVWQENRGFRRAKITNEAVKVSRGRWLIFSDGDCIPQGDFVQAHFEGLRPNGFCVGGYVRLSAEETKAMTAESVLRGDFEVRSLTFSKRCRFSVAHLKNQLYIAVKRRRRPKAYGCNISVDREVYYAVNGCDENFDGFGKEDSDLRNRLVAFGATPVSVWNRAFVFHLDPCLDPERSATLIPRDNTRKWEYYRRPNIPIRCENGLTKEESACPSERA